jgi:phage/plasmid-associated DNA primase
MSANTNNSPIIDDRDGYIEACVAEYISNNEIKLTDLISNEGGKASTIRAEIITSINEQISLANQLRPRGDKYQLLRSLPGYVVGKIILATGDVKRLNLGSSGYRLVCKRYYSNAATGFNYAWAGTYEIITDGNYDNSVARAFSNLLPDATRHDELSFFRFLSCNAPAADIHANNRLVFFRNGVYDFDTKTLTAYDAPEYNTKYGSIVSLAKLPVYHPLGAGAILKPNPDGSITEPKITNPDGTTWKPSDCFENPFDMSSEIGKACNRIIWQLTHFTIRRMNGSPHLYHFWIDAGGKGHNGKSTLWELIQRLIKKPNEPGDEDLRTSGDTVINCPIENLEKDYILAQSITTAYAIVGEESNAATSYIENCAMVKMLARAQEYTFRQIRQEPFNFRFDGALVQQCNKPPMFSEKTDSMFTHSVNIPFVNSFSDDRPYIKDDYINREEVAEWIAYTVTVEMDALTAYEAEALKTLEPFKREMLASGMSTMQALDEIVPGLKMNFIPSELLYDLYIRWCDENGVTGRAVVSAKIFRDDLEQYGINNNNNVEYITKYARSSVKDVETVHPALLQFGYSNHSYMSKYVRLIGNRGNEGYLAPEHFSDGKKGKLWTKGGLKRTIKWQDIKTETLTAEIDEDNGIY